MLKIININCNKNVKYLAQLLIVTCAFLSILERYKMLYFLSNIPSQYQPKQITAYA